MPPEPGLVLTQGNMRFTPPLNNYSFIPSTWGFQCSSASQLGASIRNIFNWCKVKTEEKGAKFLGVL
jgi:hypothetical protein